MTVEQGLALRPAGKNDARLLHDWVNEPSSLAHKLRTYEPIPWATHAAWFDGCLAGKTSKIWIAEAGGRPVGQVRADRRDDGLEVDIFVAPDARRHGFALAMLELLGARCDEIWPGLPLRARVRHANEASLKLFTAAGYQARESQSDHVLMERSTEGQ